MTDLLDAVPMVEQGIPDASVIPLDQSACLLGKSPEASVVIDDPYVSRRDAQITREQDRFRIEDLKSKNGTFVNGARPASRSHTLRNGDRIELARGKVVLRFQT